MSDFDPVEMARLARAGRLYDAPVDTDEIPEVDELPGSAPRGGMAPMGSPGHSGTVSDGSAGPGDHADGIGDAADLARKLRAGLI